MGAPVSKIEATETKTAEALLSAFKHMSAAERRKHATVFNYWLSIGRGGELPPIRDLDPLEISDAAASGVLLELDSRGEDAEILHVGEELRSDVQVKRLSEAPNPSVLSCIAGKLGIITISRDTLAFEDHFVGPDGTTRCSVTLYPFSMTGEAVNFVYGLVSLEKGISFVEETPETVTEEPAAGQGEQLEDSAPEAETVAEDPPLATDNEPPTDEPVSETETIPEESEEQPETPVEAEEEPLAPMVEAFAEEPAPDLTKAKPGFSSKVFDALAGAKGFFGTVAAAPDHESESIAEESERTTEEPAPVAESAPAPDERVQEAADADEPVEEAVEIDEAIEEQAPVAEEQEEESFAVAEETAAVEEEPVSIEEDPAPLAEETVEQPYAPMEGTLQSKLTEVRSKADEARTARLRSETLLVEGLSAAYDFALDAEEAPEEYLKLVEAQGLKIQLRSPMKPVVKLAFDGYCDEPTIKQLEGVLAWALKADLPRGSLAERIEAEGGIEAVLSGQKRRATDGE